MHNKNHTRLSYIVNLNCIGAKHHILEINPRVNTGGAMKDLNPKWLVLIYAPATECWHLQCMYALYSYKLWGKLWGIILHVIRSD